MLHEYVMGERYIDRIEFSLIKPFLRCYLMFRIFSLLVLFALTLPGFTYAQTSSIHILSFLRYDGIVVPMASMEAEEWRNIRKNDLEYLEKQKPAFYYYSEYGVEKLSIDSLVYLDWEAAAPYGFSSSYSQSEPTDNCCYPQRYDGGAFSWQTSPPIPFLGLNERDSSFASYDSLVVNEVNAQEVAYIDTGKAYERDNEFYSNGIPVRKSLRDSLQLEIKYLYTSKPIDGREVVFFTANKRYPAKVCGMGMKLEGWIIKTSKELLIQNRSYSTGDCDGKGYDSSMNPYFAFVLNGKVYIAAVIAFYEGEGKQLFELGKDRIIPLLKEWGAEDW